MRWRTTVDLIAGSLLLLYCLTIHQRGSAVESKTSDHPLPNSAGIMKNSRVKLGHTNKPMEVSNSAKDVEPTTGYRFELREFNVPTWLDSDGRVVKRYLFRNRAGKSKFLIGPDGKIILANLPDRLMLFSSSGELLRWVQSDYEILSLAAVGDEIAISWSDGAHSFVERRDQKLEVVK